MAVETLQVSAAETPGDWVLGAGASKVAAVQTPHDGDSSFLQGNAYEFGAGSPREQRFSLSDSGLSTETVNSVALRARVCANGGEGALILRLRLSGNNLDSDELYPSGSEYADFSHSSSTKPGGGAWTVADLDGLEVGIINSGSDAIYDDLRCTSLFVEVEYSPAGAASAALFLAGD